MSDSILNTTKKALGLEADYTAFDPDLTMHINSALATLTQLGVGPSAGFSVFDADDTWVDFLGLDPVLNMAKQYVFLDVRLVFDPPGSSFALNALKEKREECVWRLNVHRETTEWVNPAPREPQMDDFGNPILIDGGVG